MKPLAARWVYQITVDAGVALKKHNMKQTLRSPEPETITNNNADPKP